VAAFEMQDFLPYLAIALVCALFAYAFLKPVKRAIRPKFRSRIPTAPGALQGNFTARVMRVIDGDTVDVTVGGFRIRIRLDSIDCPEDGQDWGDVAKYGLIKLIGGKTVYLENHGLDFHGRTLATIYLAQDQDVVLLNVNERMVALGHAWVMRQFYDHLPKHRQDSLNHIEAWARSKRVGLWKSVNPIPPWSWRKSNGNNFRRN
jgi:micrococcal nuclease